MQRKSNSYRTCPICENEFYIRPARMRKHEQNGTTPCCSRKCSRELRRKDNTATCPWCKNAFHARKDQIYCSRSCAASAVHERNGNTLGGAPDRKECPVCHTKFTKGHGAYTCDTYCCIRCHAIAQDASRPLNQRQLTPDPFTYDIPRDPVRAVNPNLGF